ncbi:hypothetical protein JMUB6875_48920 [Nocardia sp. JMUB6875]
MGNILQSDIQKETTTNGDVTTNNFTITGPDGTVRHPRSVEYKGPDGQTQQWNYDSNGNPTSVTITDPDTDETRTFSPARNPDGSIKPGVFNYTDSHGHPQTLTVTYDDQGRPQTVHEDSSPDDPSSRATRDWVSKLGNALKSGAELENRLMGLNGLQEMKDSWWEVGQKTADFAQNLSDSDKRAQTLVDTGNDALRLDDLKTQGPQYWQTEIGLDVGAAVIGDGVLGTVDRAGIGLADRAGTGLADGATSTPPRVLEAPKGAGDPPFARPEGVPDGWVPRTADNGKGVVWQRPGAPGDADSVRIMDPTPRYPDGYVRFYNSEGNGQPLDLNGKPGPKPDTHIPLDPGGNYPIPKGWNQ